MEEEKLTSRSPSLYDIIELIRTLRGEKGCPWDRKQTPRSITVYLIEELFELVEAIESGSIEDVREELGDVLFQVLFVAELYLEKRHFDIADVVSRNLDKMRRRHPHVFDHREVSGIDEIRRNWHAIKQSEKNDRPRGSVLDSVPAGLPALMRAYRVAERAARTGFDWNDLPDVMEKVEEEWDEFKAVASLPGNAGSDAVALEFGDILFTLANVARFARIHPETSLSAAIRKFENRFRYMENRVAEAGGTLEALTREELDRHWEMAKEAVSARANPPGEDDPSAESS
ncbi:MAG: nucleoside triphosphate pyrophosphohydrolase [Desulfobacterales bacterium]